jgi:hypothetical protein
MSRKLEDMTLNELKPYSYVLLDFFTIRSSRLSHDAFLISCSQILITCKPLTLSCRRIRLSRRRLELIFAFQYSTLLVGIRQHLGHACQ